MSTLAARTCLDGRDDDEVVAEPGGPQVADVGLGHGIDAVPASMRGALVDPGGAQHVGAGALHEFEIIGIIDDAGGVGVLEIDGQRETMLAADEAAAIGLVEDAIAGPLASRGLAGQTASDGPCPISPTRRTRSPCATAHVGEVHAPAGDEHAGDPDLAADAVGALVGGVGVGADRADSRAGRR